MSKLELLPPEAVDRIFARLLVRYQGQWLNATAGIDAAGMRADWALELAGLSRSAIEYALSNLPTDWPPNAGQFRKIALTRPAYHDPVPALPAPKADPEKRRAAIEALKGLAQEFRTPSAPLAWAHRLKAREEAGEPLTPAQRAAWRDALWEASWTEPIAGQFSPVPIEKWPAAMRADHEANMAALAAAGLRRRVEA